MKLGILVAQGCQPGISCPPVNVRATVAICSCTPQYERNSSLPDTNKRQLTTSSRAFKQFAILVPLPLLHPRCHVFPCNCEKVGSHMPVQKLKANVLIDGQAAYDCTDRQRFPRLYSAAQSTWRVCHHVTRFERTAGSPLRPLLHAISRGEDGLLYGVRTMTAPTSC